MASGGARAEGSWCLVGTSGDVIADAQLLLHYLPQLAAGGVVSLSKDGAGAKVSLLGLIAVVASSTMRAWAAAEELVDGNCQQSESYSRGCSLCLYPRLYIIYVV